MCKNTSSGVCGECLHRCDITNPMMEHLALYCSVKSMYLMESQKTCKYFIIRSYFASIVIEERHPLKQGLKHNNGGK